MHRKNRGFNSTDRTMGMGASLSESQYHVVVEKLYEVALEPERWTVVLEELSTLVDADFGHYMLWDGAAGTAMFSEGSDQLPKAAELAYSEHYGAIDPRRQLVSERRDQQWIFCHQHFDHRYVSRSEIYQDHLIPVGARYLAGAQFGEVHGLMPLLGMHRNGVPFAEQERRWLDRLQPHLQRTSRLQVELTHMQMRSALTEQALHALNYAVIIADEHGRILLANHAAETWLAHNPDVTSRSGRLWCGLPSRREQIEKLLLAATQGIAGARTSGAIAIHRNGTDQPDQFLVLPLGANSAAAASWQRPLALLIVAQPEAQSLLRPKWLQTLFGLTPAEARLACALAEGKNLNEFAESAQLSSHTVRTELQTVLGKTGTHRQAALVRVLLSLPKVKDESV
ncbi:MAG: helix-turn-helix transcriptional regulator [Burkholderiales bacterium]